MVEGSSNLNFAIINEDTLWLLRGDEHNVKESPLVGRVESKPLELVEQPAQEIWNGRFWGDRCFGGFEEKYAYYYPDVASSCNIYVYRTPKVKGRGRTWWGQVRLSLRDLIQLLRLQFSNLETNCL